MLPVQRGSRGRLRVPISIDTRHPAVARAALDEGAAIINDISALADPAMTALAAKTRCGVILMHMRGSRQITSSLRATIMSWWRW